MLLIAILLGFVAVSYSALTPLTLRALDSAAG